MTVSGFSIADHYDTPEVSCWERIPAKVLLREVDQRSSTGDEEVLGLSGSKGVLKRSEMGQRSSEANSYVGYKKVKSGQLISNKMQAWNGMFGISPHDGITSPDYAVFEFVGDVESRFIEYVVRTKLYAAEFHCRSKGMGTGFLRLNPSEFLSTSFWLPPRKTQTAIADFLDLETARIDSLVKKKKRFLKLTAQRVDALVDKAISDPSIPRVRFENVVSRMLRPVILSEHEELVRLGLYNRGRGIFKKPAADETSIGDSSFHFVRNRDLILSGQFAWEGAVALATEEEEGCVVSHRYPVYRAIEGVKTAYLLGLLRSSFGDFILNDASRGSAGRNRPLNTWRLGKEKIPIPSLGLQDEVDHALAFERRLKKKTERSIALLNETRAAIITAAVTGQIDVNSSDTEQKVDRDLDRIERQLTAREVRA